MGLCRYCGEKAGWFSDVHEACLRSAQEGCDEITSIIAAAIDRKLVPPTGHTDTQDWYCSFAKQVWSECKTHIDQTATEHKIRADDLHKSFVKGWNCGAVQVGVAEPLSADRFAALTAFYRAMGLAEEDVRGSDGFLAIGLSVLLWSVMVLGDPTSVACVPHHPFNLKHDELPLIFFGSVIYSQDTVSTSYQGGYGGLSVRLSRGIYYHFGGFKGERTGTSSLKEVDYGGMLLTTQNLYFGGDHTSFRIPYEHVVSFRAASDGIGLFRDGRTKAELFSVLERGNDGNPVSARPAFGWFLFNLVHFLAQPETQTLLAGTERR